MLNRRILRVKVLQGLYAYDSNCDANFDIALDFIADRFAPNLNSMEPVDKKELSQDKALSQRLFRDYIENETPGVLKAPPNEVEKVAFDAYENMLKQNEGDYRQIKKTLPTGIENLFDLYLKLLKLLLVLADLVTKDKKVPEHMVPIGDNKNLVKNLPNNRIIRIFEEDVEFQDQVIRRGINWDNDIDSVNTWYRGLLKKDETYLEYSILEDVGFVPDSKILIHIIKNVLFRSELFNSFMEALDLQWSEDKSVLKSMVTKTIKNITQEDPSLKLAVLSKNWEEDKSFFNDLLKYAIENDKDFAKIISGKSKNWDISRIAKVDKIILKMAIAELINFPSIPVKVTINEYIELSKNFSTPKSKKFVNGMLDVISSDLLDKGKIRKSGRGLLDNK